MERVYRCCVCNEYFLEESKLRHHQLLHFSPIRKRTSEGDRELIDQSKSKPGVCENKEVRRRLPFNVTPPKNSSSRNREGPGYPRLSPGKAHPKFQRMQIKVDSDSKYFVATERNKITPKSSTSGTIKTANATSTPTARAQASPSFSSQGDAGAGASFKLYDSYRYACKLCDMKFQWNCRLKEHLNSQQHKNATSTKHYSHKLQEYACNVCGLRFATKSFAKVHEENYIHNHQKIHCNPTKLVAGTRTAIPTSITNAKTTDPKQSVFFGGQLSNPMPIGTPPGTPVYPFKCTICPFGHHSKPLVEKHEKLHLKCQLCKYQASHIIFYIFHMRRHHNSVTYPVNVMTGGKPIICPICTKEYSNLSTYSKISRHLQNHAGYEFNCPEAGCGQKFMRKELLRKHIKYWHLKSQTKWF